MLKKVNLPTIIYALIELGEMGVKRDNEIPVLGGLTLDQ